MPETQHLEPYIQRKPFSLTSGSYEVSMTQEGLNITLHQDNRLIPITFRSVGKYEKYRVIPHGFLEDQNTKRLQVAEVGPGLAELLPSLAAKSKTAPIAIDPLNYYEVIDLLARSLHEDLVEADRKFIHELIKRAETYVDPNRIKLYNVGIEKCKQYPELEGAADIVIDAAGGLAYTPNPIDASRIINKFLLKRNPPGTFYHSY